MHAGLHNFALSVTAVAGHDMTPLSIFSPLGTIVFVTVSAPSLSIENCFVVGNDILKLGPHLNVPKIRTISNLDCTVCSKPSQYYSANTCRVAVLKIGSPSTAKI